MNHQQRVDLYKQYMAESGAAPGTAVPFLWEFAWSRGWELPPPPFISGLVLAFIGAFSYAALVLGLWLLFSLRPRHHSHAPVIFAASIAAVFALFGAISMPIYYRGMAKRYGLSRWSTFAGTRQRIW